MRYQTITARPAKKKVQILRRPCTRCEKMFRPSSKNTRICDKCVKEARELRYKK